MSVKPIMNRTARYLVALIPSLIGFWIIALAVLPPSWFGATHTLNDTLSDTPVIVFAVVAVALNFAAVFVPRLRVRLSLLSACSFVGLAVVLFLEAVPIAAGISAFAALRLLIVYWTGNIEGEHPLAEECGVCPFRYERQPISYPGRSPSPEVHTTTTTTVTTTTER